ncbi:MAG: WG repeat-containing protein, partial [Clostridia bacterium]|nr:WG repeat-containing protein [Clostridia bacterium]
RTIAEGMGAEVEYDDEDGQIYVTKDVSYPGDDWEESTYTDDDGYTKICFRDPNGEIMLKTDYFDYMTYVSPSDWTMDYEKYGPTVNYTSSFKEGVIVFTRRIEEGQREAGYMDVYGNEFIFDGVRYIKSYGEGLAAVTTQRGDYPQYGFMNRMGEMVIAEQYEVTSRFSEGVCAVYEMKGGMAYFIDKNGEKVFGGKEYNSAGAFSDGYCVIRTEGFSTPSPVASKFSYIDHTGERATQLEWDEATSFKNGYATVRDGDVWMKINKDFEVVEYLD